MRPVALVSPARAATEIMWWHAMSGELGKQLEKLAADFNATQSDYRIVPIYKGNYTETVTAAIFAFRSRSQPAIVQVNEIATATMMAARGAIYPVFELMRDQTGVVLAGGLSAGRDRLLFRYRRQHAVVPVQCLDTDPLLQQGPVPRRRPRPGGRAEDLARGRAAAKRLRAAGATCGLTTSWPSWINVENFSAFHNLPLATKANGFGGLDAELTFNNPLMIRHIAQLAEWQTTKIFDYSGRGQSAEPRFQKGECAIFIGSSGTRADIKANAKFEVGYGMMPYWPDVAGAPQNSIIGGATLWVLRDRSSTEYGGVAKFFTYLSKPEVQAAWHQATGYLPITRAAFELSRAQGFYDRNPGAAIGIEQVTLNPPTVNSRGVRLGSFVLVRDVIEDELEQAFSGKKTAQAALDHAIERGNRLLRQFERANPDR